MFWICGYFDIAFCNKLTDKQWEMVQRHFELMLVVSQYRPSIVATNLDNNAQLSYMCHSQIEGVRPTESEIMYYIQGFFEISGVTDHILDKRQQQLIVNLFLHNNTGISYRGIDIFISVCQNKMQLQSQLNEIFVHDIDQSYGLTDEELEKANQVHLGIE